MRKYEMGGGVVPLSWVCGPPSRDTVMNADLVLAEVWDVGLSWDVKSVGVSATVGVLTVNKTGSESWSWQWLFNGNPLGERSIRRHAIVEAVVTHIPITLGAWSNA